MTAFINKLGRNIIFFVTETGNVFLLTLRSFRYSNKIWKMRGLIIEQMMDIGVRSLPLVIFVGVFAGAVASIQTAYQLKGYISFNYLGAATSVAVFIELGPVLTALVAAGRIGASIAAELGTMRVTEQIDAMEALAIDPVMNILGIRSREVPLETVVSSMEQRGWRMATSPLPPTIRMVVMPHVTYGAVNAFFNDLDDVTTTIPAD